MLVTLITQFDGSGPKLWNLKDIKVSQNHVVKHLMVLGITQPKMHQFLKHLCMPAMERRFRICRNTPNLINMAIQKKQCFEIIEDFLVFRTVECNLY